VKRYAAYKDSGVEWIGEIPVDWDISKAGYFYNIQLGKMVQPLSATAEDTLENYLCALNINANGLNLQTVKQMWFSPHEKRRYLLGKGDLLVVEGGDVGLCAVYNGEIDDCYFQNALHRVIGTQGALNTYLRYWLYNLKAHGYFDLICNKATIAHFTKDKFINTIICLPSQIEQQDIIDYLDRKTSAIDALIADKSRMIELLRERRQAIISEAVTKGLNQGVPVKDSGVEWIGEIPEQWRMIKTKFTATLYPKCNTSNLDSDTPVSFVPMECIKLDVIEKREASFEKYNSSYNLFENGDILLAKVTPCFENKNMAVASRLTNSLGFGSSELFVFRCFNVETWYMYYFFQSQYFMEKGKSSMTGVAGLKRVNADFIRNLWMPLPSPEEQRSIIEYIREHTIKINILITDIETQIELLKEYRQSLISEVVTGKIRVCEEPY
jgi:type I restriction enzyme S subunit